PWEPSPGSVLCAGTSGYQTPAAADASDAACPSVLTAASGGPGSLVAARRRRRPPNDWPVAPVPAAPAAAAWPAPRPVAVSGWPGAADSPWLAGAASPGPDATGPAAAASAAAVFSAAVLAAGVPTVRSAAGLSPALVPASAPSLSALPWRCRLPSLPLPS